MLCWTQGHYARHPAHQPSRSAFSEAAPASSAEGERSASIEGKNPQQSALRRMVPSEKMPENALFFGQPLARKIDSGKPMGRLKAPDRMLGAPSRPGAWRAARGSELSAHRQTTWHGLAAVNVIAITAFAKG